MVASIPLRTWRLIVLPLTIVAAATGVAACINAMLRRNEQMSQAQAAARTFNILLSINTDNLLQPSTALIVGLCLLLVTCLVSGAVLAIDSTHQHQTTDNHVTDSARGDLGTLNDNKNPFVLSTTTLAIQGGFLTLATVLVGASSIVVTYVGRTGQATYLAFLPNGGVVPDSLLQLQADKLGLSRYYWNSGHVQFLAIASWFAFGFGAASTAVTWKAYTESVHESRLTKQVEFTAAA